MSKDPAIDNFSSNPIPGQVAAAIKRACDKFAEETGMKVNLNMVMVNGRPMHIIAADEINPELTKTIEA